MRKTIDYAGVKIALESESLFVVEKIYDFFRLGGCRSFGRCACDITLRVCPVKNLGKVKKDLVSKAKLLWRVDIPGYIKERYTLGEKFLFFFGLERALFLFDKNKDTLKIWIEDKYAVNNTRFLNIALTETLRFVLYFYGVCSIHAAGVAKGNKGIMILGRAQEGKTIVTLQLVKDGFKFLSDDRIGLRENKKRVEMLFTPEWIGLLLEAKDLFKDIKAPLEENGAEVSLLNRKKIKIPINRLFPGCVKTSSYPKLLIFLNKSSKDALFILKISKKERIFNLLEKNIIIFTKDLSPDLSKRYLSKKYLSILFKLFEQADAYQLTYSINRLQEAGPLIKKCLSHK